MSKLEDLIKKLCPDGVDKLMPLGEICSVFAGGDAPKNDMSKIKTEEFSIPIISNGIGENAFYGYTNKAKITKPAVTVSARGTIGYAEYRNYPYFPIVRLLSIIPNNAELDVKYLYYFLQGRKYDIPSSGIPQLTAPDIKQIIIPVPPLQVQREIVQILDNFTELTAELTARKKQYEYYRDKLLSLNDLERGGV